MESLAQYAEFVYNCDLNSETREKSGDETRNHSVIDSQEQSNEAVPSHQPQHTDADLVLGEASTEAVDAANIESHAPAKNTELRKGDSAKNAA